MARVQSRFNPPSHLNDLHLTNTERANKVVGLVYRVRKKVGAITYDILAVGCLSEG